MALVDDVKKYLRISNTAFDVEINDLIAAAQADMVLCGIDEDKAEAANPDAHIKRAITLYVKASFGWDNPDSGRLYESYASLRNHLSQSVDYMAGEAV